MAERAPTKRRRRGHGEHGVYQRTSDGQWVASVEAGYVDGKRKRLITYHATRREAAAALPDLEKRAKLVQQRSAAIRTVGEFLAHWLESVAKTRAHNTVVSYRGAVTLHIVPVIGGRKLEALTRTDVQRMLDTVAAKPGAGARTVQNVRTVLRTALNDAVKWGMIDANPATHTTIARVERPERVALTVPQARAMLDQVDDDPLELVFMLAAVYGLRRGECLGVRWIDVDEEEIRIRQQVQSINGTPTVTPLKTTASRRTLPMLDMVSAALERRQRHQQTQRLLAGSSWQESGLIFTSSTGGPFQPNNLHHPWRKHLAAAGLPMVPFHSLRHTAASFLVAMDVHPRVAKEILGHANIQTTMNIYAHVQQSGMRDALESVALVLDGEKKR